MAAGYDKNLIFRHLIGYAGGMIIFLAVIPVSLWCLSHIEFPPFATEIIPYAVLRVLTAVVLTSIGLIFVIWSNVFLFFRGKGGPFDIAGIKVSPRTTKLVTQGPYRLTRNPMVFGANTLYLALCLYLNSLGCLLTLGFFFVLIVRNVVRKEEERLLRDFGAEYSKYRDETSRFIPLPRK